MNRENTLKKLFAAQEAVDRLRDEVEQDVRKAGEAYMALYRKLRGGYSNSHFPQSLDAISDSGTNIYFAGTWSRRGCTDNESCTLPKKFVIGTDEERQAMLDDLQRQIDFKEAAAVANNEAIERAKLAELKAKYDG